MNVTRTCRFRVGRRPTWLGVFLCILCVAAIGTFDAKEDENWGDTPGTCSLIVAEVLDVEPGGIAAGKHRVRLRPIATLSGRFDPGRHPTLDTEMSTSQALGTTSIRQAPPKGSTVMAVLYYTRGDRGRVVSSAACTFMPSSGSAVEVIDGLSDPKVQDTVRRIQEARAGRPGGEQKRD